MPVIAPRDALRSLRTALRLAAALCVIAAAAGPAAAAPEIAWLFPAGGQRGTTVTCYVHGSGLAGMNGLFLTGEGLQVELLPVAPPTPAGTKAPPPIEMAGGGPPDAVRAVRVTIAKDAPLGTREFRAYDDTGVSNPRLFQVGEWTEVNEVEPNETAETATRVTLPVTINAKIQQGSDRDCYRFSAKAGQQISCEVYAERLFSWIGDSWLKGFLEVLDPHGKSLATNSGRFHWDPVINFTAPEDGEYVVRFRDLNWRGTPSASYRLVIGVIPYAVAVLPAGVRRGETAHLNFTGINLGSQTSMTLPVPPRDLKHDEDTIPVRLATPGGETNSLTLQTAAFPVVEEKEPNDTDAQANPVTIPATISGRIDHPGDRDCYRFHGDAKQHLIFEVYADRLSSPMDSYLVLRDSKGKVLQENDDARDRDSVIDYTLPAAGDYVLEVRDTNEQGGDDFTYAVTVGPPVQDYRVTTKPDKVSIPAGGTARIDIKLNRWWGFDGPVKLHVEGLPQQVQASSLVIPKGSDSGVLTLESTGAGPVHDPIALLARELGMRSIRSPEPAAVRIIGEAEVDGHPVAHLSDAAETYNVQGTAYDRSVTGPVALVTDAGGLVLKTDGSEFSIKGGGEARVVVTAHRRDGAKGPVTVKADGLPAGVKADALTIKPEGEQGTIVFKAAEDAAAGDGTVVLNGTVDGPAGKGATALAPALHLTVVETPTFALAVDKTELTLEPGKSASFKVTLQRRGGFDGPVDLTVDGLPAEVTATAPRIEAGKTDSTITLKLAAGAKSAAKDAKPVEIKVSGTGSVAGASQTHLSPVVSLKR